MRCERCNDKEAAVHITTIKNGEKKALHLCGDCAAEEGYFAWSFEPQFPIHGLLGGVMQKMTGDGPVSVAGTRACSACGRTYREFARTGFLGCTDCYQAFSDAIDPLIQRMQAGTVHRGKQPDRDRPSVATKRISTAEQVGDLRAELQEAVSKEEYEKAAQLRDRIRELEAEGDE